MLPCDGETLVALAAGAALGIIGFSPLFAIVALTHRGRIRPSIGRGLAAVALSFAFLTAVTAAAWALMPADCLVLFAGMLIGFFAAWAHLAARAMGRGF